MQESPTAQDVSPVKPVEAPAQPTPFNEHEHEIVDTALAAIDTILNASMWTLAILALLLAVVAIFGWGSIKLACTKIVTEKSEQKLKEHLASDEFKQLLEDKIQKSVDKRWQSTVVVGSFKAPEKGDGEANPFPEPKGKK